MTITTTCPKCGTIDRAPDEYAGTLAKCLKCGEPFALSKQPKQPPVFTEERVPVAPPAKATKEPETEVTILSDIRSELKSLNHQVGCLYCIIFVMSLLAILGGLFASNHH